MRDLEVTYRRLLLAYPRAYRRERGLEILTTLMDAAAAGKRRPSTRDALHLVLSGLRFRFSPARGRLHWIAAALTAVFIGLSLAGLAATAVWKASPTMPRPDQVADLAGLAPAGGEPRPVGALTHDFLGKNSPARVEGWTGSPPLRGSVERVYRPGEMDAILLNLYQTMPRDGWHVGELQHWEGAMVFWAERDGVMVRVHGDRLDGWEPSIRVRTHLTEPALVTPVAAGTLVLGVLAGWLFACGLQRRAYRLRPGWQAATFAFGIASLAAQAILVLSMLVGALRLVSYWGWAQHHWLAPATLLADFIPFNVIAVGGLVGATATAVLAPAAAVGFRREPVSP